MKRPGGQQMEVIQTDPDNKTVVMAPGVNTGEFKQFCLDHGISFPANVILDVVQMGGVVCTGSHGIGWDAHPVSDYLTNIRIINSDGEIKEYSLQDEDMMHALMCNLGLWGIVVDFTLKVDPMVIVETETRWMKVRDLFYNQKAMKELLLSNWSVQFFWFPFNGISKAEALEAFIEREIDCGEWDPQEDLVWLRIINKPDKAGEVFSDEMYEEKYIKEWWQIKGGQIIDSFITTMPQATPLFLNYQVKSLKEFMPERVTQQLPHAIHFRKYLDDMPVLDMEWAFTIDEEMNSVVTATQSVVELVHKEALEGRFPMNMPMELRFIGHSEAYLTPAVCGNKQYGGTGKVCYIDILTLSGTPGWLDFTQKIADVYSKLPGAKPHWSKQWEHLDGIDDFFRQTYSAQLPKFLGALERSQADPDGMFLTDRLEKILFPGGHPGRAQVLLQKQADDANKPEENKSCVCDIL